MNLALTSLGKAVEAKTSSMELPGVIKGLINAFQSVTTVLYRINPIGAKHLYRGHPEGAGLVESPNTQTGCSFSTWVLYADILGASIFSSQEWAGTESRRPRPFQIHRFLMKLTRTWWKQSFSTDKEKFQTEDTCRSYIGFKEQPRTSQQVHISTLRQIQNLRVLVLSKKRTKATSLVQGRLVTCTSRAGI